jgi:hypothetical protein
MEACFHLNMEIKQLFFRRAKHRLLFLIKHALLEHLLIAGFISSL